MSSRTEAMTTNGVATRLVTAVISDDYVFAGALVVVIGLAALAETRRPSAR